MRIGRRIVWMAMLAAQAASLAASDPGELTLTVLVYDYTRMPAFELENAMAVAQRIFHNAGIATQWVQCAAAHESRRGSGCPETLGVGSVVLNIVRGARQGSADSQSRAGSALYGTEGHAGIIAYVFQQQVEHTVQLGGCGRFQVLGHVMAHEVGHLLLGAGSHSATGIMQPHWAVRQMARAPGGVTFTPEEAQRIQLNMKTRMQAKR